jgi:hypothetical protein
MADILLEVCSGCTRAELNATYGWMVRDQIGRLFMRYIYTHTKYVRCVSKHFLTRMRWMDGWTGQVQTDKQDTNDLV